MSRPSSGSSTVESAPLIDPTSRSPSITQTPSSNTQKHHGNSIKETVPSERAVDAVSRIRFPLLALGLAALAAGVWAGLLRFGWSLPDGRANLIELHGPLMVFGFLGTVISLERAVAPVSYTHLRAHETGRNLVCRLLLEKKKN